MKLQFEDLKVGEVYYSKYAGTNWFIRIKKIPKKLNKTLGMIPI